MCMNQLPNRPPLPQGGLCWTPLMLRGTALFWRGWALILCSFMFAKSKSSVWGLCLGSALSCCRSCCCCCCCGSGSCTPNTDFISNRDQMASIQIPDEPLIIPVKINFFSHNDLLSQRTYMKGTPKCNIQSVNKNYNLVPYTPKNLKASTKLVDCYNPMNKFLETTMSLTEQRNHLLSRLFNSHSLSILNHHQVKAIIYHQDSSTHTH